MLSQLDLFSDAITQRSENETGLWLSGLDVAAQDALELPGGYFRAPPVVCYLHRGLGGAIRRARTRLPGGGENPVSIIRIPRERMIGYGIASSLMHETGHQAAALLGLVESLRPEIQRAGRGAAGPERAAWLFFERWISEIVADLYSIARPPHPARMNSGAAGWVAAMAGTTATSSGICGPWGCAQSWGTHTVRHFPPYPPGAQGVNVVPNSARGAGDLPETDPLPQPAAASTATAASAAHNLGQRFEFRSPDAGADRMPAMVTISCRTPVTSYRAQPHPARVIGSPINYCSATG